MDAKELSVDNYITITESAKKDLWDCNEMSIKNTYCKVESFSKDEIYLLIDDYESVEFGYEDVKPIQLTEEILLKCKGVVKESFGNNTFILVVKSKLPFSIKIDINQKLIFIENVCLSFEELYLHKLQNLYFELAREELEITL